MGVKILLQLCKILMRVNKKSVLYGHTLHDAHLPRRHDNIIPYYDGWKDWSTATSFFVMDMFDRTLRDLIDERKQSASKFTADEYASYKQQLLSAVDFMARNGVEHGSISVR